MTEHIFIRNTAYKMDQHDNYLMPASNKQQRMTMQEKASTFFKTYSGSPLKKSVQPLKLQNKALKLVKMIKILASLCIEFSGGFRGGGGGCALGVSAPPAESMVKIS